MFRAHLLAALLPLLAGVAQAAAPPSGRYDRVLPAEPRYHTREQRYCLLVFGQQARTRVWLVRDGNVLHVHASPDGKSPATWRQVVTRHNWEPFVVGGVYEEGGKSRHTDLVIRRFQSNALVSVQVAGKGKQKAGWDRRGKLDFAARAKDAPVVHFDGPVTMELFRIQHPLRRDRNVRLSVVVGTPGVGAGTFAQYDCDAYGDDWPTADIEYPARQKGGKPIRQSIRLENA